ncbi:hypothetical protein QYE76_023662 [Lolium multiflorum]|uniref:CCHC-type domain-containing protein n=1 Tax=Lolium multiflorum TaxID=4521 RepID=A0AAD8RC40_LOLMU|nr:hypothetical protein QYE76_023662 [Lolium multiflorum]
MEIIIDLVDRMLVKKTLAQTQGAESSIAMLVLMNVLNKNKLFTKIVIKRLAMPTMGMTTNPTTTSSTTWNRHLIVKPMWMLKTKVIKIHQGVISETILAMTKGAEDNHNMIKMRGPSLDNANNLVKIRNNIINVSQVKLVFNSTANPMLWLAVEDLLYHPKPQEMKGEDDAEAYLSWALKVDKIFRIHNYSGAKKVAMASLEFEEYANTWWEQVVTQREEKGEPPIDTWEDMKEEMQARFVPTHYKTDLFNKLQKLKQGTKTVEEFFKEMELTMMRANIQESENQTIARFFNGLNYPIKRIVEFQQYSNMVELVHQASKAERQVNEDIKYSKSKQYFASKLATTTPTTSVKPTASSTPSKQPTIQSRMKQTVSSTASSKASTGPSNVTCFKCGTQGHKSFECKNTKVMITMENGDIETLSEGEYEALVQAAVANEEDYDEESGEDPLLCTHDPSPSLVVTRVLTTQPQAMEDQRCNIFQTRAGIGGKSIKVIIDGGSCHNLASTELCEKLNLTLRKHPHPYHVQWLSDKGNVKIQHTVTVNFKIGPYEDTIECDVVPMTVCHMLLGRPWQFDKKAIHDGYSNAYTFKVKDKKFELRPMTPSQIIADNAKALARAQHHTHHSELRGEGATHQKESERHQPHMSERKSVLLATKREWREVKDNPSTTIHYVLICKGLSSETNDLTNIPSSLLSLLKEFQDVFPDELPHGLPPLRGIEHRIDLIPGAPLPNRAAYRTNPEDTKEIQRQIQDLLAKGTKLGRIPTAQELEEELQGQARMAAKVQETENKKASKARIREGERGQWWPCETTDTELRELQNEGMISAHWSFIRDTVVPKPGAGEVVMTKAWVERGLSLPCSEFFLSVLNTYGLQPHNICPNSYLLLSNFATLCEGHLGIRPDVKLWQFFFRVKKETKDKAMLNCGSMTFMLRPGRMYPPHDSHESVRYWNAGWFYEKNVSVPEIHDGLPKFNNEPPEELASWSFIPSLSLTPILEKAARRISWLVHDGLTGTQLTLSWFTRRIQPLRYNARLICAYTGADDQLRATRHDLPADSLKRRFKTLVKVGRGQPIPELIKDIYTNNQCPPLATLAEENLRTILRVPVSGDTAEEVPEDEEEEEEQAPRKAAPRPTKRPRAKASGSEAGASGEASAKKPKIVKPPPLDSRKAERERLKMLSTAGKRSRPNIPGAP